MVVFLFQDSRFSSLRTTLLKLELPKPIEYCRWSRFIMRDSVCGNRLLRSNYVFIQDEILMHVTLTCREY
ncbi:hypothetical protein B296_00048430 [Ensete ventricosum]|uniref:Uncharacterized protein n=1 Tax=Ensete ventricosum TaxID=4639 RepID=A0A426YLY3_ENSVE|nr:hypothetical protein B296_00048430 [Ensete ventricosum]